LKAEDTEIKSAIAFETKTAKYAADRQRADKAYEDAIATKTSAEGQITTLDDLIYDINDSENPEQAILDALNNKIEELKADILEAENTILAAQEAFNTVAQLELELKIQRDEQIEANAKQTAFLEAESRYNEFKSIIDDINARLEFFEVSEEPAEGEGKDEKELPACAPQFMYELDYNNIPQVSW